MPTSEKSPDKMPTFGWHFVWLAFCPVGILSAHPGELLVSDSDRQAGGIQLSKVQCPILLSLHAIGSENAIYNKNRASTEYWVRMWKAEYWPI